MPDPLKLDLQMVVLYRADAGDRACVLCKGITALAFFDFVFFFSDQGHVVQAGPKLPRDVAKDDPELPIFLPLLLGAKITGTIPHLGHVVGRREPRPSGWQDREQLLSDWAMLATGHEGSGLQP